MKIAVIGSGNIGGTLGRTWERAGHAVTYASRSSETPIGEALADAEVVLVAIPGGAVGEFVGEHGGALEGKLVIDATNRLGEDVMNAAAEIQPHASGYVRAFNSVGWEVLAEPGEATMFWAGHEDDAAVVEQLVADVGLRPVRVGGEEAVAVVDGVGRLWLTLVFRAGYPRQIAFKLLGA